MTEKDLQFYLEPTFFMDSDSEIVKNFAQKHTSEDMTLKQKAVSLFYAVRDEIFYSPYDIDFTRQGMKASSIIERKKGYCVAKAVALCAALKAVGIPARPGLADVKNHLTTKRLKEVMGTDTFYYHGYTELYLNNKWIKVTPTFNKELCDKFRVKPLDFDGENDSLFHEYDEKGRKHMSYLKDFGHFDELPYEEIKRRSLDVYKNLFTKVDSTISGDFAKEAEDEFLEK
ncbi:MAG: transglutaminase-like domain-containing protein [Thermodesulfobacteriota bacterium]